MSAARPNPYRRSSPAASPRPAASDRRGSRTSAGRSRRSSASRASRCIRPWRRSRAPPASTMRSPSAGTRTSNFEPTLRSRSRSSRRSNCTHMSARSTSVISGTPGSTNSPSSTGMRNTWLSAGATTTIWSTSALSVSTSALRAIDLGQRDIQVLAREACHRLVVGEARLVQRAFRQRQCRAVLVELRLRRIVRRHELPCPVERLLSQRQVGDGAIDLRLAHGDRLSPEPRLDARQLGVRHAQVRLALPLLGDQFRIVDADQRRALAARPASAQRRSARCVRRRAPPCRRCATAPRPGPPAAPAGSGTRSTARSSPRTAIRR